MMPAGTRGVGAPKASLSWATSPGGPYTVLWRYQQPEWRDGDAIDRTLLWPEVDRQVRLLPAGTKRVYVRYQIDGMAIDDFRLAAIAPQLGSKGILEITHVWREFGTQRKYVERIPAPGAERRYTVNASPQAVITNEAVMFECR